MSAADPIRLEGLGCRPEARRGISIIKPELSTDIYSEKIMHKRINFEDNIFVLNTRIRMVRDLLILDTDPELFLEKTMDDAHFIDLTLAFLLGNLLENERLIERDEQFHNLSETEQQFSEVLSEILEGAGSISVGQFPVIRDKTAVLRNNSQERRKNIEHSLSRGNKPSLEPVVSSDELSELLKGLE